MAIYLKKMTELKDTFCPYFSSVFIFLWEVRLMYISKVYFEAF